jgi:methylisocitrate lyase
MCDRIKAAVDARLESNFIVMARTDSFVKEGLWGALARAERYVEAGADAIFAEALSELSQYQAFTRKISVPILANLTEFGKTPLFTLDEMRGVGIAMVLYPLTVFRIINKSAEIAYRTVRSEGTQKFLIDRMQTREETYDLLNYYKYEKQIGGLNKKK